MKAAVRAIEYYLPEKVLSTEQLAAEFPEWSVAKIDGKTGIQCRHIAAEDECSSDLAVAAARRLFASGACRPEDVDYLLLCTQSPDYFLPTTACLVQERLGLPTGTGAVDFNQGCSGFIYGLGLAQGLIETGQAKNVLLLTAETYSKFIHPRDKSVRTIFGDAAAATLLSALESEKPYLGPFVYGTDGRGGENLIVPTGGMRRARTESSSVEVEDESGNIRTDDHLFMNGLEVFNFAGERVPEAVRGVLEKAQLGIDNVDLFVFHQANKYMLDHLRKKLRIPEERFQVTMGHCGNTVSSTIPIALKHAAAEGRIHSGQVAMLVGFGVGYSWGATLVRWAAPSSVST
ncbi:MAG TPA: 3-oxoacyl-ACP synthase [Solibacterales bacterium]|nr:3-oxoacyl-ACP synthase [Bryobacterales bacterium]